jgi:hypothetical protein
MGTWGTAIFADDEASDVRGEFRFFLAEAQSVSGATNEMVASYGVSFETLAAATAFWLGLALTQWRLGRLDPRVRDAALRIIDDGIDLKKWEGSPDQAKRGKALAAARVKILSPLPSPCRIPKPLPVQLADWMVGEVVGFRLANGRLALFHVVRFSRCSRCRVKAPTVSFLNWFQNEMPTQEEATSLTDITNPLAPSGIQTMPKLILATPRERPLDSKSFVRPGIFIDLLPGEQIGSGASIISVNEETLDSIVQKALRRWWNDPALTPKAPPPWMMEKPSA